MRLQECCSTLSRRLKAILRRLSHFYHSTTTHVHPWSLGSEPEEDRANPKVSVIVPVYKTEKYVEKCIRSVMAQTFGTIEVICVDDASPDHSAQIVKELASHDRRIRLIQHHQNLGLGGARNTGITAARASYVIAIDSDDYILPMMIERLWEASGEGTADVVSCGMAVFNEAGELSHNICPPAQSYDNESVIDIFNTLSPSFCNKMWRKDLFTTHGIHFPENHYFEDLATSPRLLHFAKDIRVIPDPLYCYIRREGSIMSSASLNHILDYFATFDLLSDFLEAEDLMKEYRQRFEEMIGKHLVYHARSAMKMSPQQLDHTQYIRCLLMLKLAYMEFNVNLRTLGSDHLQELLLKETSLASLLNDLRH